MMMASWDAKRKAPRSHDAIFDDDVHDGWIAQSCFGWALA